MDQTPSESVASARGAECRVNGSSEGPSIPQRGGWTEARPRAAAQLDLKQARPSIPEDASSLLSWIRGSWEGGEVTLPPRCPTRPPRPRTPPPHHARRLPATTDPLQRGWATYRAHPVPDQPAAAARPTRATARPPPPHHDLPGPDRGTGPRHGWSGATYASIPTVAGHKCHARGHFLARRRPSSCSSRWRRPQSGISCSSPGPARGIRAGSKLRLVMEHNA